VTNGTSGKVGVAVLFPDAWDTRPAEAVEADRRALAELDPRIDVVDLKYVDPDGMRSKRGAEPTADFSHLIPPLTPNQEAGFERVEVVLTLDLPYAISKVAPRLRWVQSIGAGVSQLTSAGLADAGVRLTSGAGVNAVSISEFVLARLLQFWKRLPEIDSSATQRTWQPTFGREVSGLTLGVVGLGAIGRQVAIRGRALGMRVIAQRRTARPGDTDPDVDQLLGPDGLLELAQQCDAIVAAVPETPDTIDIFDREFFAALRPGAFFVNVGRGSAVVEPALLEALSSGQLAGAALDVVREEPLPATSPLWEAPNLFISPHSATAVSSYWGNVHALFRDNLRRYLDGQPLRNEVDPRTGDGLSPSAPR
jgi:phosphoglycerate dehydrogenase-like enzyme